ncbi:hypothetical protein [Helicobacter sp. T3_23-1056]
MTPTPLIPLRKGGGNSLIATRIFYKSTHNDGGVVQRYPPKTPRLWEEFGVGFAPRFP